MFPYFYFIFSFNSNISYAVNFLSLNDLFGVYLLHFYFGKFAASRIGAFGFGHINLASHSSYVNFYIFGHVSFLFYYDNTIVIEIVSNNIVKRIFNNNIFVL